MSLEQVTLEGRLVRLEPLGTGHVAALWRIAQHPDIWTWMPWRMGSQQDMAALVEKSLAARDVGSALPFVQVWKETGEVYGSTSYLAIDLANRRLEIGATWLTPAFQRTAANTEAKLLLLAHAFDVLGCNRVEFKTDHLNARSRAAIRRLGALEEGALRAHMVRPDGTLRDSVYFSILRSEWPAVREGLLQRLARDTPAA
jgi:N-acetyltransferase